MFRKLTSTLRLHLTIGQFLYLCNGQKKFREDLVFGSSTTHEKGERPTKSYFFNLEKRNYSRRVISELELEEGDIMTNEKQILSEIENYFLNLYSSKTDVSEEHFSSYVEQLEFPRLSHEMSLKAEGLLTYEECKESLDTFSPGKSPGEDGFTVEFYLTFFDLIEEDLVNSLNSAYQNGELSISQRRGVKFDTKRRLFFTKTRKLETNNSAEC